MRDEKKFCGLSQLGKKAGSMSMTGYLGFVYNNYPVYSDGLKKQKEKPPVEKDNEFII